MRQALPARPKLRPDTGVNCSKS